MTAGLLQPSRTILHNSSFSCTSLSFPKSKAPGHLEASQQIFITGCPLIPWTSPPYKLNANITTVSGKIPTKYAGSASAGGSANSAVKLDNSAGSAIQPVYFSGGKPVACTHTLGKSVPANAVFTDTNTKAIREIVNLNFISAGEKSYAYVAKAKCGLISATIIGSVGNMFDGISKEDSVEGSYVVWVQGSVSGSKQCELVWMPYN